MIFVPIEGEPTVFLMLTEADCNDMRGGRTKFIDRSAAGERAFNKIVLSLHKNQGEIEEMLRQAGHGALLRNMPSPIPQVGQAKCAGCEAIMDEPRLLDGRCIACWRELAMVHLRRTGP